MKNILFMTLLNLFIGCSPEALYVDAEPTSTYIMTKRSDAVTDFVRDGSRSTQLGDYVYSLGGWTDNGGEVTYNDVYRSTGNLSTWEKLADAPWHPRHVFGCFTKANQIWVLGGDNLNTTFDIWVSSNGTTWNQLETDNPSELINRIYFGCTLHNIGGTEWIYIVGGAGHKDIMRSADGATWETVATDLAFLGGPTIPEGEGFAGSLASFNGKLYLVGGGGTIDAGPPRKSVWRSSDNGVTWEQMADLPAPPRRYTDVITFDNKLWVVNGYDDTGVGNLKSILYMNKAGRWTEFETPSDFIGSHATALAVYEHDGKKELVITCGNYNNHCWVITKQQ